MFFDMYQHENLFDIQLCYLPTYLTGYHSVGAAWLGGKLTQRSSQTSEPSYSQKEMRGVETVL